MPFLGLILPFLGRYWKYVLVILVVFGLVSGIYLKGRADCRNAIAKAVASEQERVYKAVERERTAAEKTRNAIRRDRMANPRDDKRDSCILSNNPYEVNCLD